METKFNLRSCKPTLYRCPYCNTMTSNRVKEFANILENKQGQENSVRNFFILTCETCSGTYILYEKIMLKYCIENNSNIISVDKSLNPQWGVSCQKLLYPQCINNAQIPSPSRYMPNDVLEMYKEAVSVFDLSPRSSAALIRLTLETLLKRYLVNDGKEHNLNTMIGMSTPHQPKLVTEFMDMIRKAGNEEVHPKYEQLEHEWGDITRDANKEEIIYLFKYINTICDFLGLVQKVENDYNALPDSQKQAIQNRNDRYSK